MSDRVLESSMTAAAEQAIDDLVDEIAERIQSGHTVDIEDYCQRSPEIAERLRKLFPTLKAMADIGHSLARTNDGSTGVVPPGRALGDFRIFREIGRGGMGVVYEAEQLSLARRVALKVLPFAAVLDRRQLQRFKNEALAAAQLDHPHLVDVYGVGCERGVHYYAMRFIDGKTLAEVIAQLRRGVPVSAAGSPDRRRAADPQWAPTVVQNRPLEPDEHPAVSESNPAETASVAKLSTHASNTGTLFFRSVAQIGREVAEALDHAHRQGVVHRDVKPSNLMLDEQGKAWVTDFGLARIDAGANLTATGDLLGTLRYMSPEQTMAKRVVIDHRSDVYSLGVTLYELLALRPAFPDEDRRELLRRIGSEDPPPPRKFNRSLPAELETIVLKAMAKNPEDRYATAEELADDLSRFLQDEPIRAKRPSFVQRARKWSRRHRGILNAACIVLGTALVGLAVATALIWKEQQATQNALSFSRRQQDLAQQKRRESEAVLRFLVDDLLLSVAPEKARGRKLEVRDVLRNAEQKIDAAFPEQPRVEASVRNTMGTVYYSLGDYKSARRHLIRALALRKEHLGNDARPTLVTQNVLGAVHFQTGRWKTAESLFDSTWRARRRILGEAHLHTLQSMQNKAAAMSARGKSGDAFALYEKALRLMPRGRGRRHSISLVLMSNVANRLFMGGKRRRGRDLFEKTLNSQRRILGASHPETLRTASRFARVLRELNRTSEALALCRRALDRQRRNLGDRHPDTMRSEYLLGTILYRRGKVDEAVKLFESLLPKQQETLGPEHDDTLTTMTKLAGKLRMRGEYDRARPLLEEALSVRQRVLGPKHSTTLATLGTLGAVFKGQGDLDGARACHEKAYQGFVKTLGENHRNTLTAMCNFANVLRDLGETEKARELGEKAMENMRRTLGPDHPNTLMAAHNLAYSYENQGDLELSRQLREQTARDLIRVLGRKHPHTLRAAWALRQLRMRLKAGNKLQRPPLENASPDNTAEPSEKNKPRKRPAKGAPQMPG